MSEYSVDPYFSEKQIEKFGELMTQYIQHGVEQDEDATAKMLKKEFLRRIALHYGAQVYFNDEPRGG